MRLLLVLGLLGWLLGGCGREVEREGADFSSEFPILVYEVV
jgi:hypothetical protein